MNIAKAYEEAVKSFKFSFGEDGHLFTALGFITSHGAITGPHYFTRSGTEMIMIDKEGKFLNSYTVKCDSYIPWLDIPKEANK